MEVLAFRFAFAGNSLLCVFLVSVLFGITPLRLAQPEWFSVFSETLLSNSGFALVGISFLALASYFDPDNQSLSTHQRRVLRLCGLASLAFLFLIPLQFYTSHQIIAKFKQEELYQYDLRSRQVKFLAEKVKEAQSFDQLQSVMRRYQSTQLPESERFKPLQSIKDLLLTKIKEASILLKNNRRSDLVKANTWEQYKLAIRNSLYSLTYSFAFAAFAQRRNSEQSILQEMMGGFLNRLYAGLQRREQLLSNQPYPASEPSHPVSLNPHRISNLHQQGMIDQGWLIEDESPNTIHPESQDLQEFPQDGTASTVVRQASGVFSWIRAGARRREDDPSQFLEILADQHSDDQVQSPELHPPEDSTSQAARQTNATAEGDSEPGQRPGSAHLRRQRVTDLDYFEQLAEQHENSNHPDKQ